MEGLGRYGRGEGGRCQAEEDGDRAGPVGVLDRFDRRGGSEFAHYLTISVCLCLFGD